MEFGRIEDALDKWVIIRFTELPDELKSPATGLGNAEGKLIQYKLRGVDHVGIWIQNPWFELASWKTEASKQEALVLVKWEYVATIIYLGGQQVEDIPIGFQVPSPQT